jgi:hypothetical protein
MASSNGGLSTRKEKKSTLRVREATRRVHTLLTELRKLELDLTEGLFVSWFKRKLSVDELRWHRATC